jgi:uncharacterized repeat protein (TIGR03803 family)
MSNIVTTYRRSSALTPRSNAKLTQPMKTSLKNRWITLSLKSVIAFVIMASASLVGAQTLTTLYSFTGTPTDGGNPMAALVQGSNGDLYGTTYRSEISPCGSSSGPCSGFEGTVFKITTSGGLTTLYKFPVLPDAFHSCPICTHPYGGQPMAGLVQGRDGNFYGTTAYGGTYEPYGTVFKITPDGFKSLYSFNGYSDGGWPMAALVQGRDGNFYGTTSVGGPNGDPYYEYGGTVFKITPSGALTNLYSFTGGPDGGSPMAALVQGSDGNLYGTTEGMNSSAGTWIYGTVFKITTNGDLTTLYSFTGDTNGGNPTAGLVQGRDGNFYGTTSGGGAGFGTVFEITTNGVLTTLHSFSGYSDGGNPTAGLVQGSDGNFYGTTSGGGSGQDPQGTVFEITTNGDLTTLYNFTGDSDGGSPTAALVQGSDGNFYGTTGNGGSVEATAGTVFRLILGTNAPPAPPVITTQPANQTVTVGGTASFSVAASGTAPLSYQWYFNSGVLANATNATLALNNVQITNVGIYYAVVSNAVGSVNSLYAVLRVWTPSSVVAWGDNTYGQTNVPSGLTNVVAIATLFYHSLALKSDGTVVAWGWWNDDYGQCNVPSGLTNVVAVGAGALHSVALKSDGTVVAWGDNSYGHQSNVPSGLTNAVAIASGGYHSLALKGDGTVVVWGWNALGQCNVPSCLTNVVAIASGGYHSLALKGDGTVVAWGYNISGQANVPSGLTNVVAVAGGDYHSLALKSDGTVVAWGCNTYGQCNVPSGLTNVVAIAGGEEHSLALKGDGTVVAWGYNAYGQCNVPSGLTNAVAIAGGDLHSLALENLLPPVITSPSPNQTVTAGGTAAVVTPRITMPTSQAGTFSFNIIAGVPGTYWNVYESSNLVNWTLVGGVTLDGFGDGSFTNGSISGGSCRFYKLGNGE